MASALLCFLRVHHFDFTGRIGTGFLFCVIAVSIQTRQGVIPKLNACDGVNEGTDLQDRPFVNPPTTITTAWRSLSVFRNGHSLSDSLSLAD